MQGNKVFTVLLVLLAIATGAGIKLRQKASRQLPQQQQNNIVEEAVYGYCPICGARGHSRERRLNGNDYCVNGHSYPSSQAVNDPNEPPTNNVENQPAPVAPTTYRAAVDEAVKSKRQMVVVFSASWCPPCKKMKANVWPDPAVKEKLSKYLVYFCDVDREADVAKMYGVRGVPAYGVMDFSSGQPVRVKWDSGERTVKQILEWIP